MIVTYKHNFICDIRVAKLCLFLLLLFFSFVNGCRTGRRQIFFQKMYFLPSVLKCFIFIYHCSKRKIKLQSFSVFVNMCLRIIFCIFFFFVFVWVGVYQMRIYLMAHFKAISAVDDTRRYTLPTGKYPCRTLTVIQLNKIFHKKWRK